MSDSPPVPAIEFRNVSVSFDELRVLDNISFSLAPGEMIFITGAAASGKSTLLRLAIGLMRPDEGRIFINGREIEALEETELIPLREGMGMVFQEDSLFSGLPVYDNAAYRLVEHGVPEEQADVAVREILRFVGLENDADRWPEELSGGMRRRLEIARALMGWPPIMLFDEPASGLDPITAVQVLDLIIRARDIHHISSLYITKKLDEIPYLARHRAEQQSGRKIVITDARGAEAPLTRVFVLDAGRIAFEGSVDEFENSEHPEVRRLTRADNGTLFSDFETTDPWDKRRQPRDKILEHGPRI